MEQSIAVQSKEQKSPRLMRTVVAIVFVLIFLITPMFLIKSVAFDAETQARDGAAAATVAIGAIFRSNSRTLLRSTLMSALRTALRTITRRVVRSFLSIVVRLFLPVLQSAAHGKGRQLSQTKWLWSLILGGITLGLSFTGVVVMSGYSDNQELLYGFSLLTSGVMASSALAFHVFLLFWLSRNDTLSVDVQTPMDGVLLQAYFTGALSYLPLSSDITLKGDKSAKGQCAAAAMVALIIVSLFFDTVGILLEFDILRCWGAHLLLYSFVVSFPLKPLSGADVFAYNRVLWTAIFVLNMLCFLLNIPDAFYEIL
jgi:hypothetical protein